MEYDRRLVLLNTEPLHQAIHDEIPLFRSELLVGRN